ncbi:MAG: efflux RND transporter periplasmic adaptor subunit [Rhizomicrobium sp.]
MSDAAPAHQNGARRRWLIILGAVVLAAGVLYGLYWFFYARHFQTTDDAYVGGDIVAVTSQEPGAVIALHADNTQGVRRGELLVELDPIKAKVAVQAAEADLARTVRAVRTAFLKVNELRARQAAAQVALVQAQSDSHRRAIAGSAVSSEELAHARDAVTATQAGLRSAQSALEQGIADVRGTSVATHPDVLAAIARLRHAMIVLAHMRLSAPVDGVVAQRTAQLGQQIAPGMPLMAVVPLDGVWVDANFKEVQLRDIRVGQPVTVTADAYGGGVVFHGKVAGLAAGSGSAFALLPPQNASGNWIKIVQRVPVRIELDPRDLREHPLRIGLSVSVSIDVRDTSGSAVASPRILRQRRSLPADGGGPQLDRLIDRIIAQNAAP